jgi:phosphoglycerate dehydrogenase-like enzyme
MSREPINILVALPVDPEWLGRLQATVDDVVIDCIAPFPPGTTLPVELLREQTILLADFAPKNVHAMTSLQWMQLGSAGYEQLAKMPLTEMGVQVTNASGVNDVAIAEWCVLMMLAFERDLPSMLELQAKGEWEGRVGFQSELRGRRVGIIGYGNIGRETGRLCAALGLELWAMSRNTISARPLRYAVPGTGDPDGLLPTRRFKLDQMAEFLPYLDYVILTVALNTSSRHLLAERELDLLPRSAVLLNPARAELVEEHALLRALRDGKIAGAALDSHYREPLPPRDPFWSQQNVLITPHISGSSGSPHYSGRVWELFSLNLGRFRRGEPLLNQVAATDLGAPL